MTVFRYVRPSIWAAVVYLGVGCLWISFSDDVVQTLAADAEGVTFLQNVKGWAFVVVTSVLVYLLTEAVSWRNRKLRALNERFRVSFQESPLGIALLAADGRIEIANPALARILGRPARRLAGSPLPHEFRPDGAMPAWGDRLEIELPGGAGKPPRWLELRRMRIGPSEATDDGGMLLVEDVTRERRARVEQRLAAIAFESRQPSVVTDREGTILRVNRAFVELTGYPAAELLGRNPRLLQSGHQSPAFYEEMWRRIVDEGHWEGELWNRNRGGSLYQQWLSISAVRDDHGRIDHLVGHAMDLSERRAVEARIEQLEQHDPLTGLPNRARLLARLAGLFEAGRPHGALVLIDIDRFHLINEGLGVEAGDAVLRSVARSLNALAPSDGHFLARISADVFAVALLPRSLADGDDPLLRGVGGLVERVRRQVRQLDEVPAGVGALTVSVGAHLIDQADARPTDVLSHAEQALSQARRAGPNGFRFFEEGMQAAAEARLRLATELRVALETDCIAAHFQPKCRADGRIVGVEVLARWTLDDGQAVPPATFVPMVEALGLEVQLGDCMLHHALGLAADLARGGRALPVSVNLTARELRHRELSARIGRALDAHGLPASSLMLEVTESQLIGDYDAVSAALGRLRERGHRIAIDDFGTGYSSLSYLKRLPIDELKIDGSFVADAIGSPRDGALLGAIVTLGSTLGLEVVAEAVESAEQVRLLERLGCGVFQGRHFSPPVDAESLLRLVQRGPVRTGH